MSGRSPLEWWHMNVITYNGLVWTFAGLGAEKSFVFV